MAIEQGSPGLNHPDRVTNSFRSGSSFVFLRREPVVVAPKVVDNTPMNENLFSADLEKYHEDLQIVGGNTAIAVFETMKTYDAYPVNAPDEVLKAQKDINDTVATNEMTRQFNLLPYRVNVITAEGLKDIANGADIPHINGIHGNGGLELAVGEKIDKDVIVDPLEGTTLSVKKLEGVTVSAAEVEPGGTIEIPDGVEYMQKIFAPMVPGLSIDDPADITITKILEGLNIYPGQLRVTILNRSRNSDAIREAEGIMGFGNLNLIDAGDLLPSVMASSEPGPDGMYNLVLGIGGGPEGIISAAAAKATGKTFVEARWWPKDAEERKKHSKLLTLDELIPASSDSIVVDLAHITPDSIYTRQKGIRQIQNGHVESLIDFTSVDMNGIRHHTRSFQS